MTAKTWRSLACLLDILVFQNITSSAADYEEVIIVPEKLNA